MKILCKMNRIGLILFITLLTVTVKAQKDPEAVRILTEFSRKAQAAPSVRIEFETTVIDSKEDDETTTTGSAVISGDNYRVMLADNIIFSDSKTVWSYLPDVNEVTITEPNLEDESFMARPSLLFTLYEKNYKVRLLEGNSKEWVIDLYPEDIKINLVLIRLRIGKTLHDLKSAEYRTKDGIDITLTALKYDLTFRPDRDYFTFNPTNYKGVEVIDMR